MRQQPFSNTFTIPAGITDAVVEWESKGLPDEKIKLPTKLNNILSPRNELNLFIVYELDASSRDLDSDFTPKECFSRAVKLAKKADPDKYFNSGYGIGFSLGFSLIFSFTE